MATNKCNFKGDPEEKIHVTYKGNVHIGLSEILYLDTYCVSKWVSENITLRFSELKNKPETRVFLLQGK